MSTQAVYEKRGTTLAFQDSSGDKLLAMNALAATTGRLSAFADRGAGASPSEYEIKCFTSWVASPTVGETLNICVVQSDGTHQDAGVAYHASNDAALTLAAFNAVPMFAGAVSAHTADVAEKGSTFRVRLSSRYFAIGVYNASAAKTLTASANATIVYATPIMPDIQAEA